MNLPRSEESSATNSVEEDYYKSFSRSESMTVTLIGKVCRLSLVNSFFLWKLILQLYFLLYVRGLGHCLGMKWRLTYNKRSSERDGKAPHYQADGSHEQNPILTYANGRKLHIFRLNLWYFSVRLPWSYIPVTQNIKCRVLSPLSILSTSSL